MADLTYRFVFDERDHDGVQRYTLRRIDGDGAATTEHPLLTADATRKHRLSLTNFCRIEA
ncbi:hypothetical protein AB0346_21605 [Nocardia beijingensis]|uniref:hypothetical protein n=1 Tax=Nocardia beijingensis TaxID=95162 RepID=UPI00344F7FA3